MDEQTFDDTNRKPVPDDRIKPHAQMFAEIERLLILSKPPSPLPVDLDNRQVFSLMILCRCREMLRAVVLLTKNNMLFLASGLVRSIFESAATGIWLLEDENNINIFWGDQLHNYQQLVQARPEIFGNEDWSRLFEDAPFAVRKMPSLEDRLTPELKEHYVWYRDLCSRDHCSITSICQTMELVDGLNYVVDGPPNRGVEQRHLGYAAMQVFHLTGRVFSDCGFKYDMDFVKLGFQINSLMMRWNPAEGVSTPEAAPPA